MIKALLFDWGNTVMIDFNLPGPMFEWKKAAWVFGAEDSLRELSLTYACYIATNAGQSDSSMVLKGLKRVGADKYFHHFFTSKDLGAEKPDKRFFNSITKEIDIANEYCLMIGDSYTKDICGAKAVGMKTIFFNEKIITGNFPDADQFIFSMNELVAAINLIKNKT